MNIIVKNISGDDIFVTFNKKNNRTIKNKSEERWVVDCCVVEILIKNKKEKVLWKGFAPTRTSEKLVFNRNYKLTHNGKVIPSLQKSTRNNYMYIFLFIIFIIICCVFQSKYYS